MSGIGYRQLCQHLAGDVSLEEAVARIKTETHRLARMQYTWFRQDDRRIHWLDMAEDPYPEALRLVESEVSEG
jgi:tRNA dimethylallyltransferase